MRRHSPIVFHTKECAFDWRFRFFFAIFFDDVVFFFVCAQTKVFFSALTAWSVGVRHALLLDLLQDLLQDLSLHVDVGTYEVADC